jgi:hypothetical protein
LRKSASRGRRNVNNADSANTVTLEPGTLQTETGAEAVAANACTLTLPETGEKVSKRKPGKPDKRGLRYFKIIKNKDGEDEEVEITRSEFKEDRRLHFTVRHGSISRCGHRFIPGEEPRQRNCDVCWFTFFQVHGELTQAMDELYAKHGKAGLLQLRGPKFVKNFLKFMSTVAQWKKEIEATQKNPEVENGTEISAT